MINIESVFLHLITCTQLLWFFSVTVDMWIEECEISRFWEIKFRKFDYGILTKFFDSLIVLAFLELEKQLILF